MAEKITVPVEVAKEFHELLQGIIKLVKDLKPVLKDGWQVTDIGPMVAACIAFTPALKGVENLPTEFQVEPGECAMAGAIFASDLVKSFK